MIDIPYDMVNTFLSAILYPFFRISSFIAAAPLLGHKTIPMSAKIAFAFALTITMMAGNDLSHTTPVFSWEGFPIIFEQILIGTSLGLMLRILFAVVQFCGEAISLQMGLGFATFFSPDTNSNTLVISRFLYMITLLIFLSLDGHLMVIRTLNATFDYLPIGQFGSEAQGFEYLAKFGSIIITSGFLMSLPVLAPLLIVNITMGILNRSVPQFTIFSIGFPISMLVGMVLLIFLVRDIGGFLEQLSNMGFSAQIEMIKQLS